MLKITPMACRFWNLLRRGYRGRNSEHPLLCLRTQRTVPQLIQRQPLQTKRGRAGVPAELSSMTGSFRAFVEFGQAIQRLSPLNPSIPIIPKCGFRPVTTDGWPFD